MSVTVTRDDAPMAPDVHRGPDRTEWTSDAATDEGIYDSHIKPTLDILIVLLVFPVVLPITLVAMLLVKLTSAGPALYQQTRVGRHGKRFTMYKIRSMYQDAEETTGPRWCLPGDPRITPVGWVLRKSHIDELPQLWNVLRGELSLVGPRPERPEITAKIVHTLPDFLNRLDVRPGLSGLAQVQQAPDTSLEMVRVKLNYDLYYVNNVGLWLDLRILVATVFYVAGVPARIVAWLFRFPHETDADATPAAPDTLVLGFDDSRVLETEVYSR